MTVEKSEQGKTTSGLVSLFLSLGPPLYAPLTGKQGRDLEAKVKLFSMSWPTSLVHVKEGRRAESRLKQTQVHATAWEKSCARRSSRIFEHLEGHCLQPEPSRTEAGGLGASECKRPTRGFCDVWIFVHILIIMLSEEACSFPSPLEAWSLPCDMKHCLETES